MHLQAIIFLVMAPKNKDTSYYQQQLVILKSQLVIDISKIIDIKRSSFYDITKCI